MSDLTAIEKRKLERALGMSSGYVLSFSNRTFQQFFFDVVEIDIYDPKYAIRGGSKANRLRGFWSLESNHLVGKALALIFEEWDEFRVQDSSQSPPDDCLKIVRRLQESADTSTLAPMNLSAETLRMAETQFRHAQEDIVEEHLQSCHRLQLQYRTSSRLDSETAKIIPPSLRKMGYALVDIYLKAFELENRVPVHEDEAQLDRMIELLFAGAHGLSVQGLPLGGDIPAVEQRIVQYLHAQVQEMRLKAKSSQAASRAFNLHDDVTGDTGMASGQLKVFLCHSSSDKTEVRSLFKRLSSDRVQPWLDEEDLLAGQDWDYEIKRAVKNSHVVVACLSKGSVNKSGYVQKEIKLALDVADEQPEGTIFVIPLKLEECEIPERLSRFHSLNYYEQGGHDRLLKALRRRAQSLGLT